MSTWVWVDGDVVPASAARVSALDRGLLSGEGVYETCKVSEGSPFALTRHLARLRSSAALVGMDLPWGDSHVRAACAKAVGAAMVDASAEEAPVGRLRITVTAGAGPLGPDRGPAEPMLLVAAGPSRPWAPTAVVATVPWRRNEHSPAVGAKATSSLDNVLALRSARERGADEAVLTNTSGFLAEGTSSNLFLVVDGVLCTPALSTGCLAGVTRALVCELVPVVERDDLTVDDLRRSPEAFLTSSTRDVHPIAHVDDLAFVGAPGPLTAIAAAAFSALQADTIDP